jgi:hypothetical protein
MRLLVAIAFLAALVVPFAPLARTASAATYAASYSLVPPTATASAYQKITVGVRVTNTGSAPWQAPGTSSVSLTYRWIGTDGSLGAWSDDRAYVGGVLPGESTLVDLPISAPSPLVYRQDLPLELQVSLVRDAETSFAPSALYPVKGEARLNWPRQAAITLPQPEYPGMTIRWKWPAVTQLPAGTLNSVDVTVRNTGELPWPAGGANPVRLAYHWFDASGRLVVWDGERTSLPTDLAPGTQNSDGQSATLHATVRAPATPGQYFLVFDMVQDGVAWFGHQTSSAVAVTDPARSAGYGYGDGTIGPSLLATHTYRDVLVLNSGTATWAAAGPIRLSYHWRDANGALLAWDGLRSPLPQDIPPGAPTRIRLEVDTPNRPGTYVFQVDGVEDGVTWFSSAGSEPYDISWTITSGMNASYGSSDVPSSAASGASVPVQLTLTNTGQQTWSAGGANPVHVAYHVYDAQGRLIVWDGERGTLPHDVLPGTTLSVNTAVRVPTTPGGYGIGWDLVREGIGWFSDFGVPIRKDVVVVR